MQSWRYRAWIKYGIYSLFLAELMRSITIPFNTW